MSTIFFRRFFAIIFVLAMPIYGAENTESSIETKYKSALQYRDGTEMIPQDFDRAKQLFLEVIEEMPNHAKALHNLGVLAHGKQAYEEARDYFVRGAELGLKESSRNIWKMQMDEKIPASPKERFLAICNLNDYTLPVDQTNFNFNCQMGEFVNSGTMNMGGALYAKTLNNSGYLSFPLIWVENEKGFSNTGQINTKLLIVGKKRII